MKLLVFNLIKYEHSSYNTNNKENKMTRYYPGLNDALRSVDNMTESECLRHLNALYGIDNLKYGASIEDVRDEVRRQIREDFTDRSRPEDDAWIAALSAAAQGQQ
jgi:hypothetical protein